MDRLPSKKDQDIYFLACINRFLKYPTVETLDKTNQPNVVIFLGDYIQLLGVPINSILEEARCLIGIKVKKFQKENNINIIPAPAKNHRAI